MVELWKAESRGEEGLPEFQQGSGGGVKRDRERGEVVGNGSRRKEEEVSPRRDTTQGVARLVNGEPEEREFCIASQPASRKMKFDRGEMELDGVTGGGGRMESHEVG